MSLDKHKTNHLQFYTSILYCLILVFILFFAISRLLVDAKVSLCHPHTIFLSGSSCPRSVKWGAIVSGRAVVKEVFGKANTISAPFTMSACLHSLCSWACFLFDRLLGLWLFHFLFCFPFRSLFSDLDFLLAKTRALFAVASACSSHSLTAITSGFSPPWPISH